MNALEIRLPCNSPKHVNIVNVKKNGTQCTIELYERPFFLRLSYLYKAKVTALANGKFSRNISLQDEPSEPSSPNHGVL